MERTWVESWQECAYLCSGWHFKHRGHLIPNLSLTEGGNGALAKAWVDSLYALMRASLDILGTESGSVDAAFERPDHDDNSGGANAGVRGDKTGNGEAGARRGPQWGQRRRRSREGVVVKSSSVV